MAGGLLVSASPANATLYDFSQTGFDGGGIIRGNFEATDSNSDGFITKPEVTAFSLSFSGDSIVADFSQGLNELYVLDYHIGTRFLGDETLGSFQEQIGTNWFGSTGFSYASGRGTSFDGGSVTDLSAPLDDPKISYTDEYVTIPVPGTIWLFGAGLIGLRVSRRY